MDLLAKRFALPHAETGRIRLAISDRICGQFPELHGGVIGFYWPIKGEIDLHETLLNLVASGAGAALPVIEQKLQPLQFWRWRPGMKLGRGHWNIPVPTEPDPVQPTALLIPLVGFDAAGYRLGYGGGYYDRTIAAMRPKPLTIGVGYELGRLETIYPQAHDVPLDAIVTESRLDRF
jgi:5-formyltetrahydrofolate cyclo-ligase